MLKRVYSVIMGIIANLEKIFWILGNHGNEILESVFDMLHIGVDFQDIPPFLVFQKVGTGRDVKFFRISSSRQS